MMWWSRRGLLLATLVAALLVGGRLAIAQAPSRADAAISGIVMDAATKRPIPDAVVQLGSVARREYAPEIQQRQFTDAKGRFVFTDLAAGSDYTITAAGPGYFDGAYGRTGCTTSALGRVAVADGQWFKDATIALCRPGSISGTVIDERGEPVIGVYVRGLLVTRVAGHDRYAVGPLTTTDDRGMYRIGRLAPGRYATMVPSVQVSAPTATVQVAGRAVVITDPMVNVDGTTRLAVGGYPVPPPPANGRAMAYPAAFSGGPSLAQMTTVPIDSGEDRVGVDVRISPVPVSRVSGVVNGAPDVIGGITLRLVADGAEDLGTGGETGTALVSGDGSFTFLNVPEGRYTIEAPTSVNQYTFGTSGPLSFYEPQLPRAPGLTGIRTVGGPVAGASGDVGFSSSNFSARTSWARSTVDVSGDVSGLVLTLQRAGSITGHLVVETAPNRSTTEPQTYVDLESATGSTREGRLLMTQTLNPPIPHGEFRVDGVLPGLYVFRSGDPSWMIKSVVLNGRDYTNAPLDTTARQDFSDAVVTFTNAVPSLTGSVRQPAGGAATDAAVIVFPAEPEQWTNYGFSTPRIRSVHSTNAGTFRLSAIPAGDYLVLAVPEAQIDAWHEPGFFSRAQASATRITIGWGESKTVNVTLVDMR